MATKQKAPKGNTKAAAQAAEELEEQVEEAVTAEAPATKATAAPTGKRALYQQEYKAGKSRAQIAKEQNTTYQNVYAATKDMENNGTGGGNADGSGGFRPRVFVEVEDDKGETVQMPRSEYIRKQYEAGVSRGEIAKELGVAFQIVYAATKNMPKPDAKADEGDELEEDDEAVDTEDILEDEEDEDDGDELEDEEEEEDDEEEDED